MTEEPAFKGGQGPEVLIPMGPNRQLLEPQQQYQPAQETPQHASQDSSHESDSLETSLPAPVLTSTVERQDSIPQGLAPEQQQQQQQQQQNRQEIQQTQMQPKATNDIIEHEVSLEGPTSHIGNLGGGGADPAPLQNRHQSLDGIGSKAEDGSVIQAEAASSLGTAAAPTANEMPTTSHTTDGLASASTSTAFTQPVSADSITMGGGVGGGGVSSTHGGLDKDITGNSPQQIAQDGLQYKVGELSSFEDQIFQRLQCTMALLVILVLLSWWRYSKAISFIYAPVSSVSSSTSSSKYNDSSSSSSSSTGGGSSDGSRIGTGSISGIGPEKEKSDG